MWPHLVCYTVSPLLWFVFLAVEGLAPAGVLTDGTMYWDIFYMLRWPGFYFTVALATTFALLPSLVVKVYITTYHPTPADRVMREMVRAERKEQANRLDRITSGGGAVGQRASVVFGGFADSSHQVDDGQSDPPVWHVIRGEPTAKFRASVEVINASRFLEKAAKQSEGRRASRNMSTTLNEDEHVEN